MVEHLGRRGPHSTIRPSSMKATWLATSRAKPISCVTTIIVMPSSVSCRTTASTSPTSSGSSAEVTSSNSSTAGRHGERAGDGDALGLASGKMARIASRLSASPTLASRLAASRAPPCAACAAP